MSYIIKTKGGNPIEVEGQQLLGSDHIDIEMKDFSDKERSFLAVASVESPDRMGDVISVKGWELDNYVKNPVVMPFHNYSTLPVGRSLGIFSKGKKLMFVPQFAPYPEASRMYEMFRDKYLKGFSVGFIPKESKKIETEEEDRPLFWHQPTKFIKQELLEVSVAPIPAHQDALSELKTMVKKGDIFIPQRYLMDKNEPYVESFDEYIHVIVESEDKFKRLYITPLHMTKDGMTEEAWAWVVYGPCKDNDHNLYFNQCFIFPKDENSDEEKFLKWAKENDKEVDINADSKDSPIILSLLGKDIEIKLEPFDPRKYEAKSPVLVELPQLEKEAEEEVEEDDRGIEDIIPEQMVVDADSEELQLPVPVTPEDLEKMIATLDKNFKVALELMVTTITDAFKEFKEAKGKEELETVEEEIDIDSIENEPVPGKKIIELEDETKTLTPNEENIDLGVPDDEFKGMVKSAVNAFLGRLEDE